MSDYEHSEFSTPPPFHNGLSAHEARSEARFEELEHELHKLGKHYKGEEMSDTGLNSLAAMAALANNNRMGTGTALGATGTILGGLALLSNLGRRNGLLGGGDDSGGGGWPVNQLTLNTIQSDLGDLKGQVASVGNETQVSILNQTGQLQNTLGSLALGIQQAFANTKDAIQAGSALNLGATNNVNQNVLLSTATIKEAIDTDGDRTRGLITSIFQTQQSEKINALTNKVAELESDGRRSRDFNDLNLQITNTNAQSQGQAQAQNQFQMQQIVGTLNTMVPVLNGLVQVAHATNQNLVIGNTGAVRTGSQTANPTNVNA